MGMCPRCKDKPLVSYSLEELRVEELNGRQVHAKGLVVEQCGHCRGVFLDATGADQAVDAAGDLLKIKGAALLSETCKGCGKEGAPGDQVCSGCKAKLGLACPSCDGVMVLAKVLRVEVDVCQGCDALWFDDGEIGKVHRRFRRRKARGESHVEEPAAPVSAPAKPPAPLPTVKCLKCKVEGFRLRDVYKTKEGHICRPCMGGKPDSDGRGLSVGMMNDGSVVGGAVDAMVTLAVVDAVFDLFRS